MMDATQVRTNLEAVANQVEASDKGAADRLRELSYAVKGGPNADAWAASNIYQIIEPEQIIQRYKNQQKTESTISILEWVRNSLIFAPLVVTWFGISQAVDKYTTYTNADTSKINYPFLYLWQQGFGQRLPGWLTLSSLAGIDFVLLSTVLILTLIVYSLSNVVRARREQEAEEMRARLAHALAGAGLFLTTRRWTQPTNFVDRFDKVIQHFDTMIRDLITQVDGERKIIGQLMDRQKQEMDAFSLLKTELATIMRTVVTAVTEMKTSSDNLARSLTAVTTEQRNITTQQGAITGQQGTLITESQKTITMLQAMLTAQQESQKKLDQWGKDLQTVLGKLDGVIPIGQDIALKTAEFLKIQNGLIAAMRADRAEQAEITSRMKEVSDGLRQFSKQLDKTTTELNSINVYMHEIVRRIAAGAPIR